MTVGDRRLARLLNSFPEIVAVLDGQGNVLWANQLAEEAFDQSLGVRHRNVRTSNSSTLTTLRSCLRSLETVQSKNIGTPLEIRAKSATTWRLVELIGTAVPWFQKGAVLFSIRDLTDRRRFELARDNVARFRSLVHNATTIHDVDLAQSGEVESVSGAMTRMLGHDPEAVERQPLANIVAAPDRPVLRYAIENALRSSSATHPVVQALRLLRRGGEEMISYELSIVSLVDDPTVGGSGRHGQRRLGTRERGNGTPKHPCENSVKRRRYSTRRWSRPPTGSWSWATIDRDELQQSVCRDVALPTNLVASRNDQRLLEYGSSNSWTRTPSWRASKNSTPIPRLRATTPSSS